MRGICLEFESGIYLVTRSTTFLFLAKTWDSFFNSLKVILKLEREGHAEVGLVRVVVGIFCCNGKVCCESSCELLVVHHDGC